GSAVPDTPFVARFRGGRAGRSRGGGRGRIGGPDQGISKLHAGNSATLGPRATAQLRRRRAAHVPYLMSNRRAHPMGLGAVCPGTSDPVTNGHLDIISRAAGCFDDVVVAVLENPSKAPLFSTEERVGMLKEAVADLANVEVDSFSGLLVDYAPRREGGLVVEGLRAVTGFDVELQMGQMDRAMSGLEIFFVATSPQWSYLSSSLIKEVVRFGGDVSGLVPGFVRERLQDRLAPLGD